MATGQSFKGGWRVPLLTVNTMSEQGEQPSLSEGLRIGAKKAHRQQCDGLPEGRNFRRSLPVQRARVSRKA